MKSITHQHIKRILAVGLICLSTNCAWAHIEAGKEGGNGGTPTAASFIQSARTAIDHVALRKDLFPALNIAQLNDTLKTVKIIVTDERLYVDGFNVRQESAAVNYPSENLIRINRGIWKSITSSDIRQMLALHELLGIEHLERTGVYTYSEQLLPSIPAKISDGIRIGPIYYQASCEFLCPSCQSPIAPIKWNEFALEKLYLHNHFTTDLPEPFTGFTLTVFQGYGSVLGGDPLNYQWYVQIRNGYDHNVAQQTNEVNLDKMQVGGTVQIRVDTVSTPNWIATNCSLTRTK